MYLTRSEFVRCKKLLGHSPKNDVVLLLTCPQYSIQLSVQIALPENEDHRAHWIMMKVFYEN